MFHLRRRGWPIQHGDDLLVTEQLDNQNMHCYNMHLRQGSWLSNTSSCLWALHHAAALCSQGYDEGPYLVYLALWEPVDWRLWICPPMKVMEALGCWRCRHESPNLLTVHVRVPNLWKVRKSRSRSRIPISLVDHGCKIFSQIIAADAWLEKFLSMKIIFESNLQKQPLTRAEEGIIILLFWERHCILLPRKCVTSAKSTCVYYSYYSRLRICCPRDILQILWTELVSHLL